MLDVKDIKNLDSEDLLMTYEGKNPYIKYMRKKKETEKNYQESQVGIGRNLFVWDEDIKEITAYIPDEDGVVRSGAY